MNKQNVHSIDWWNGLRKLSKTDVCIIGPSDSSGGINNDTYHYMKFWYQKKEGINP